MEEKKSLKISILTEQEITHIGLSQLINSNDDLAVVAQCYDSNTCLIELSEKIPDVLIIDANSFTGSLSELNKQARSRLPNLKIIVLTENPSDTQIDLIISSGVHGILSKLESGSGIIQAIKNVSLVGGTCVSQSLKNRMVSTGKLMGATSKVPSFSPAIVSSRKSLLSPRELEILGSVAQGLSAKQIGSKFNISAKTVERHKSNIMSKLEIHSQVDLTRYAIREGIIAP